MNHVNSPPCEHTLSASLQHHAAALVRDHDAAIVVRTALQCAGMSCTEFSSVESLLRSARREHYQLLVIDSDSGGTEWRNLLDWRSNWLNPSVPLIGLGPADPALASMALASGVDDYLAKPLHGGELLARVTAATRRGQDGGRVPALSAVGCTVDRRASTLCCRNAQVQLTSRELGVMEVLLRNLGTLVPRQRLAAEVWSCDTDAMGRTIEQHIYQLRRKLKRCTGGKLVIHSVYGSGYRLEALDADLPAPPVGAGQHDTAHAGHSVQASNAA